MLDTSSAPARAVYWAIVFHTEFTKAANISLGEVTVDFMRLNNTRADDPYENWWWIGVSRNTEETQGLIDRHKLCALAHAPLVVSFQTLVLYMLDCTLYNTLEIMQLHACPISTIREDSHLECV